MKRLLPVLFLLLACLAWSCNKSFNPDRKGMEQLYQVLEKKFGAGAWYNSIILVHDAAGDDMITVERAADPDKAMQEQWTWFHGFWEQKADIELKCSGIQPRDLLFQLQNGNLQQMGKLAEQALRTLAADPANGRGRLIMAGIERDSPSPEGAHHLAYTIQLRNAAGVRYSYRYDEQGEPLPPAAQP